MYTKNILLYEGLDENKVESAVVNATNFLPELLKKKLISLQKFAPLNDLRQEYLKIDDNSYFIFTFGSTSVKLLTLTNYNNPEHQFDLFVPYSDETETLYYGNYLYVLQNNKFYTFVENNLVDIAVPRNLSYKDIFVFRGIFLLIDTVDTMHYSSPTRLNFAIPEFRILEGNLAGALNFDNSPVVGVAHYSDGFLVQTENNVFQCNLARNIHYLLQVNDLFEFTSKIKPISNELGVLFVDSADAYIFSSGQLVNITQEKFTNFISSLNPTRYDEIETFTWDLRSFGIASNETTYLYKNQTFTQIESGLKELSLTALNQNQISNPDEVIAETNTIIGELDNNKFPVYFANSKSRQIGFLIDSNTTKTVKVTNIELTVPNEFKRQKYTPITRLSNIYLNGVGSGIIKVELKSSLRTTNYETELNKWFQVEVETSRIDITLTTDSQVVYRDIYLQIGER